MNRNYGKRWHALAKAIQTLGDGVGGNATITSYGHINVFVYNRVDKQSQAINEFFPITPKGLKDARKALLAAIGKIKAENSEPRLTKEAQAERDDFELSYQGGNCSCHISPPCGSCTHPGNPKNQAEDESAWVNGVIGD